MPFSTQVLQSDECLHAVGQGALAVECRSNDKDTLELLKSLNHRDTVLAAIAERAVMRNLVCTYYGQLGCWESNSGIQNLQPFTMKIDILKGRKLFILHQKLEASHQK